MRHYTRFLIAASAATLIFACAKKEDETATDAAPADEMATTDEATADATVETADDPNQVGTANVEIGMQNGAPYFSEASEGFCASGACQSGVVLDTGDVDLSGFPPGDVLVTVTLNQDALGAGYSFPSDGYQAVGIAIIPPGGPQFGQQYWPSGFLAPVVSGNSVSFTDLESDESAYEYSIGLNGPNGRIVMDPTITNGGKPPAPEPEPEPVPQ